MVDRAFNLAPEQSTAVDTFLIKKDDATQALNQLPATRVAHSANLTVADKGKLPYVDANGEFAKLTIGANGSLIYAASGLPAWLAPGSDGQTLTMSSGAPAWGVGPAFKLISSQTVSSPVSQVVFTNIPSSGYTSFRLVYFGAVTAAAATTDTMRIHVSTDNGSTFKTTSGDYYTDVTASNNLVTLQFSGANSTFQHAGGVVEFIGLGNSARATAGIPLWRFYGISTTSMTTQVPGSTEIRVRMAAEADNAFRIVSNGASNITAGRFYLYGMTE